MVQTFRHVSGIFQNPISYSDSSSRHDLGGATLATSLDHESSDANVPDPENAPQKPDESRMPMLADQ